MPVSFWIFLDQICPNLIKLDQTWSNLIKMAVLFLIFFDQIWPKWIKLDQTWSNWISHQSKNVIIKSCHIHKKNEIFFWIKSVQNGSNLNKLDFSLIKNVTIKSCHFYKKDKKWPCYFWNFWIRSVQNGSSLIKLVFLPIKNVNI